MSSYYDDPWDKQPNWIQRKWKDFWYDYKGSGHMVYGGPPSGHYEFNRQKLINIIFGIITVIGITYFSFFTK